MSTTSSQRFCWVHNGTGNVRNLASIGQGPLKWTEKAPLNNSWLIWDEFETFIGDHFWRRQTKTRKDIPKKIFIWWCIGPPRHKGQLPERLWQLDPAFQHRSVRQRDAAAASENSPLVGVARDQAELPPKQQTAFPSGARTKLVCLLFVWSVCCLFGLFVVCLVCLLFVWSVRCLFDLFVVCFVWI